MANIFDARRTREQLRHETEAGVWEGAQKVTDSAVNLIQTGFDIASKVGQQIGTQQAQDWSEQYEKDYEKALSDGTLFKDKDGNMLESEEALQKRTDEWSEQYKIDNPQPSNMWAKQVLDASEKASAQQRRTKSINSMINNFLAQSQENLNNKVNNIISSSYENPIQVVQNSVASYGLDFNGLSETEQKWYSNVMNNTDGKAEIDAKKLNLSLAYRTAGYDEGKIAYSIQGATPAIEDTMIANNLSYGYQSEVIESGVLTDSEFNNMMNEWLTNEYTDDKGFIAQDRIDGIKAVVQSKNKIALANAKAANNDAYNSYVVPAVQNMYANSKWLDTIQYPNTQTITALMKQYGVKYELLDDDTKKSLSAVMENGDSITTLTNAIHNMNSIASGSMPTKMKQEAMTNYLANLSPDQVKQIEALADLDPYKGKYSQFTDKDIYEYVAGISSPQLVKNNVSDEYIDTDLSAANVDKHIQNYFMFSGSPESVLFADSLKAIRASIEAEVDGSLTEDEKKAIRNEARLWEKASEGEASDEYYEETRGETKQSATDKKLVDVASKAYNDAVDFIAKYGDTELEQFGGKTLNSVLAGYQSLYTNRLKATTNIGADGRIYFPETGISTTGLLDSQKAQVEKENMNVEVGTGLVYAKLLDQTTQDQREAILDDVYAHSNEYKESDVKIMEQIVRGDPSKFLEKNGLKLSDYLKGLPDSSKYNTIKPQASASIARLIPTYYKNGVFDKAGFDEAAKKVSNSLVSSYADSVYFQTIEMDMAEKPKKKSADLVEWIRNPNKTLSKEADDFVSRIITDSGKENGASNFTYLMLGSLDVTVSEGTTFSKLLAKATLEKLPELSEKDRAGLAMATVFEKLGINTQHQYGKGTENEFLTEAYAVLNDMPAMERNFVLDCAGKLNDISEQTTALKKQGIEFGVKSDFDDSFYSTDFSYRFTPKYDTNGTLSFDIESLQEITDSEGKKVEQYTSVGNSNSITKRSLTSFSGQVTKVIHKEIDSATQSGLANIGKTIGIGNSPEAREARKKVFDEAKEEKRIESSVISLISDSNTKLGKEFASINERYMATHNGVRLKPVVVMKNDTAYRDNWGFNFDIEFIPDLDYTSQWIPKEGAK